ncbi:hypothetical protein RRG08_050535 [Elysia crispata]|uniref:Uncharacterized protein n=1 Tax=Elysia crispata TaxID=231223 RepID=A0AAE0ZUC5_9GAST|nr:hypothetical protein RRG08_050535 [Elysia crispata]
MSDLANSHRKSLCPVSQSCASAVELSLSRPHAMQREAIIADDIDFSSQPSRGRFPTPLALRELTLFDLLQKNFTLLDFM